MKYRYMEIAIFKMCCFFFLFLKSVYIKFELIWHNGLWEDLKNDGRMEGRWKTEPQGNY